jgi:hypothetical protein
MSGIVTDNLSKSSGLIKAAAGGAWTLLEAASASNASILEATGQFSATYKMYMIVVNNLKSHNTGSSTNIYAQMRSGGSYLTGSYYEFGSLGIAGSSSSTFQGRVGQTQSSVQITADGTGNNTDLKTQSIMFWIDNPASTTYNTNVRYHVWGVQNETKTQTSEGCFTYYLGTPVAMDGLKIYGASGNITGSMYTYGLAIS